MSSRHPSPDTAARMREIAGALAAAGMDAQVHATQGVLDITASLGQPASKPVEVIVDEDGYVQISYWNDPGAAPGQVAGVITAVLAAITAAAPGEPARVAGSTGW
jgi:hypothetical protein